MTANIKKVTATVNGNDVACTIYRSAKLDRLAKEFSATTLGNKRRKYVITNKKNKAIAVLIDTGKVVFRLKATGTARNPKTVGGARTHDTLQKAFAKVITSKDVIV